MQLLLLLTSFLLTKKEFCSKHEFNTKYSIEFLFKLSCQGSIGAFEVIQMPEFILGRYVNLIFPEMILYNSSGHSD